jgi:hypothetical protein
MGSGALARHNQRRRANRAIRRNVVEWARRNGCGGDELEQLAAAPPNLAKKWIEAKGFNPDDFVDAIPDQQPVPVDLVAPAAAAVPAPAAPVAAAAGGGGGGRVGGGGGLAAGGGGAEPVTPPAGGGGAEPVTPPAGGGGAEPVAPPAGGADGGPAWESSAWCTPGLRRQILEAIRQQGGHRDERSLLGGKPTDVKTVRGGTNTTMRVELDNGAVGYFKPFDGVADQIAKGYGQDSSQQPVHEAAAWRLASQMGSPWSEIVPPVVIREINGRLGSFAVERPGRPNLDPWHTGEWREAAFFDCLVGQQDRHPGNYLVAGDRIALIDHGYTFARPGDLRNYSWLGTKRVQTDPALTYTEREVLQRLVSSPDLLGLRGMLQPARADALRDRAQVMLESGQLRDAH